MTKPIVTARKPLGVDLEAGKSYAWCASGRSRAQPFCDGSHAGTGLEPKVFTVDEDEIGVRGQQPRVGVLQHLVAGSHRMPARPSRRVRLEVRIVCDPVAACQGA